MGLVVAIVRTKGMNTKTIIRNVSSAARYPMVPVALTVPQRGIVTAVGLTSASGAARPP